MLLAELLLAHTQHYRFITVQIVQSWRRLVTCRTDSITVDIHSSQHFSGTMFLDGISVVLLYIVRLVESSTLKKKKSVTCFTDSVCRLSFQFSLFQVLQTTLSHSVKYDVIVKTQRCVTVCVLCGVLTDFHFSSQTATNFFSPLMGLDCFCKNSKNSEGGHFKSSDYVFSTWSGSQNFHNAPGAVLSCHFLPHLPLRMSICLSDDYLCGIWRLVVSFVALVMVNAVEFPWGRRFNLVMLLISLFPYCKTSRTKEWCTVPVFNTVTVIQISHNASSHFASSYAIFTIATVYYLFFFTKGVIT